MKLFYYHSFLAYFDKRAQDEKLFEDLTEKKAMKFLKRVDRKLSKKVFKFDKKEPLFS